MKAKIERYARGEFGVNAPKVSISREFIQLKIEAGTIYQDAIHIDTDNDCSIKGIVYDDNYIIDFDTHSFIGKKNTINYTFDATKREIGYNLSGHIYIITDGGEYTIPYSVEVVTPFLNASTGHIDDMSQFVMLAEKDWNEAIRLYESEEFRRTFLSKQVAYQKVYESLSMSLSANQALEEFLVYIHKKRGVNLGVYHNEFKYDMPKMKESHELTISKNTWGYIYTEIRSDCKFIEIPKRYISMEDFTGNEYKLTYYINPEYVENDNYKGHIFIENTYQDMEVTISIRKPVLEEFIPAKKVNDRHAIKTNQVRLIDSYLDFCVGRIRLEEYLDKSRFALNNLIQYVPHSHMYRLGLMHMNILAGDTEVFRQEMVRIDADGSKIIEGNRENSYYNYLKACMTKEPEAIDKAAKIIRANANNQEDKLFSFWLLMHLDSEYSEDKLVLYKRIEQLYAEGLRSPIMYYEVCNIYNNEPLVLRQIDDLAIAAIRWGLRQNFVSDEIKEIFVKLSGKVRHFSYPILAILREIYEDKKDKDCLFAICSLLIKDNKLENKYNPYFKKAIEENLKIISINEAYIRSLDFTSYGIILHQALLYLNYKNTLNEEELAYVYANVVTNKSVYRNIYQEYTYNIEAFMEEQILKGNMSDDLSVIYAEFLNPKTIKSQYAAKLVNIIFKRKLTCNNELIKMVVVTHKELAKEEMVPLVNGVAYIDIINDSAAVALVDVKGNRYVSTIPYRLEKLVEEELYIKNCERYAPDDYRLLLYNFSRLIKANQLDSEAVNNYRQVLETPEFNYDTVQTALLGIVHYYYDNFDKDILAKYMHRVDLNNLDYKNGKDITTYFVACEMYANAYEAVKLFGYNNLPDEYIIKLVEVLSAVDNLKGSELITSMCIYLYRKGYKSDNIMEWLISYYKSSTKELSDIWDKTRSNKPEVREFEENVLAQIMFSDKATDRQYSIFKHYYEGKKRGMVIKAFLKLTAYNYFINDAQVPDEMFECLYEEILEKNIRDDISIIAVLYYFSRQGIDEKQQEFVAAKVREFIDRGTILPFFKAFKYIVSLPKDLDIKTYLIYKGEASKAVYVSYNLESGSSSDSRPTTKKLQEVLPGLYIEEFVVFHGENLVYTIDTEAKGRAQVIENTVHIDMHTDQINNRFDAINNMLIRQEMKDDKGLLDSMDMYLRNVHLFESNMKLL